jgi:hypothetical protein
MTLAARTHDLHGVPATLFLALAARALAPIEAPELGFAEHKAEHILQRLEIDPQQRHHHIDVVASVGSPPIGRDDAFDRFDRFEALNSD